MHSIQLPKNLSVEELAPNKAKIVIEPLHPGFGTTIGNSLRRVLLSSLPGSAITAIKIKGVQHEFSTLNYVKEDIVEIILNLKKLRVKSSSNEPVKITLEVKGNKEVTAGDFDKNADVEIVNPDFHIATLTDKAAEFKMEAWVENGMGYSPVESREEKKTELGTIEIDSIFSPVRMVNFDIENVRVGQLTNFNKLTLDIETDGSIKPVDAFKQAAKILVDHFSFITEQKGDKEEKEAE